MDNKFTITFTEQQMNVLNAALQEVQYKYAAPLITHINAEIQKMFDEQVNDRDGT